jgi:hypothetical protein
MNKDFFEKKFKKAILSYPNKNKLIKAMKKIAKIVESSISNRKWKFNQKTEEELFKALEICKDYEDDCDVVYNIKEHVFEAQNGSINTVDCPIWENFRDEMKVHLEGLPERGFVYIAWRASPFTVYYVGMTERSGGDRILDISSHTKLTLAIERGATQFTIIYPDISNNIRNVEASFIRIMKKLGYIRIMKKPLKQRDEKFVPYEGEISALEKFFEQMRKMVKQYN